jgi:hypothetical protein
VVENITLSVKGEIMKKVYLLVSLISVFAISQVYLAKDKFPIIIGGIGAAAPAVERPGRIEPEPKTMPVTEAMPSMSKLLKDFRKDKPYTKDKILSLAEIFKKKGMKHTGWGAWVRQTYLTVIDIDSSIKEAILPPGNEALKSSMTKLLEVLERPPQGLPLRMAIATTLITPGTKREKVKFLNVKYGVEEQYPGIAMVALPRYEKSYGEKIATNILKAVPGATNGRTVKKYLLAIKSSVNGLKKKFSKSDFLRFVAQFYDTIERYGLNNDHDPGIRNHETMSATWATLKRIHEIRVLRADQDESCKTAVADALQVTHNIDSLNPHSKGKEAFPLYLKLKDKVSPDDLKLLKSYYGIYGVVVPEDFPTE